MSEKNILTFESTNPLTGWDGRDALTGTYSRTISYANQIGKEFKLKGNVAVVK